MRQRVYTIWVSVSLLLLFGITSVAQEHTVLASNGLIVYVSELDGATVLNVANASDGSGLQTLISYSDFAREGIQSVNNPQWSPDGKDIVFTAIMDTGDAEIFIVDVESGDFKNLTMRPDTVDTQASWSTNGETIVFASREDEGDFNIWQMIRDGSNLQIRDDISSACDDMWPVWSPNGRQIAVVRGGDIESESCGGHGGIWIHDELGADLQFLLGDSYISAPSWSPDGTRLAFSVAENSTGVKKSRDIIIADILPDHEPSLRNVTPWRESDEDNPAWSPDGRFIVFDSNRTVDDESGSNSHLYQLDLTKLAEQPKQLTRILSGSQTNPSWNQQVESCPPRTASAHPDLVGSVSQFQADSGNFTGLRVTICNIGGAKVIGDDDTSQGYQLDLIVVSGNAQGQSIVTLNNVVGTPSLRSGAGASFNVLIPSESLLERTSTQYCIGVHVDSTNVVVEGDESNNNTCLEDISVPINSSADARSAMCHHVVKTGDNLFRIGVRYGYSVDELLAANPHIEDRTMIFSGNIINFPDCVSDS